MINSIFLDTNIVIDILDSKRKHHKLVSLVLKTVVENEIKVYVSEDMMTTIYYILKGNKRILDFFEKIRGSL